MVSWSSLRNGDVTGSVASIWNSSDRASYVLLSLRFEFPEVLPVTDYLAGLQIPWD